MANDPILDGTLTGNYNDLKGDADISRQSQAMIYIEYTKGTEDECLLKVEYSVRQLPSKWFTDTIHGSVDGCRPGLPCPYADGSVDWLEYNIMKILAGGNYRYPIPVSTFEDVLRVSAKCTTPGLNPGSLKVYSQSSFEAPPRSVYDYGYYNKGEIK